jgi:phosphatidylserine decarboxylase
MSPFCHQYIERATGSIRNERLFADPLVRFLYNEIRENAGWLFKALTSPQASHILGVLQYDLCFFSPHRIKALMRDLDVCLEECLNPEHFRTARAVFERKIRYWSCRPQPPAFPCVLAPSDSRMLPLNLSTHSLFPVKGKFFDLKTLMGESPWHERFAGGRAAVFRLTPDKYHYNHCPVSGEVLETFMVEGRCHACHPDAVVREVTPFSRNRRLVTLVDTDIPQGSGVGLVAMVEVVALMIGGIREAYSHKAYENPQALRPGMRIQAGCPKSLFYPGSSTVVLLFEPLRMDFEEDLVANSLRRDVQSRFCEGFGPGLVETDLRMGEVIGRPVALKPSLSAPVPLVP